jgi:hypothetical protein
MLKPSPPPLEEASTVRRGSTGSEEGKEMLKGDSPPPQKLEQCKYLVENSQERLTALSSPFSNPFAPTGK